MYREFFKLETMPFDSTPDPQFFFESEQHREALAAIEYTIRMRKGFVMVTGEVGSGKTTVGRVMVRRCASHTSIVQILHGHRTPNELIKQIMRALNVRYRIRDDHARLLERLQTHLLDQLHTQRPVVLLVDEAQTLSDEALEELRLLSNFDTATSKLTQIILIGQPELRQRISSRRLNALRQRIVMAKRLNPLSAQETGEYICHRIRVASVDPQEPKVAFTLPAIGEIYRFSRGIPRLINSTCDNCLLMAYVKQADAITPVMVRRVITDMAPRFDEPMEVEQTPRFSLAGNG